MHLYTAIEAFTVHVMTKDATYALYVEHTKRLHVNGQIFHNQRHTCTKCYLCLCCDII